LHFSLSPCIMMYIDSKKRGGNKQYILRESQQSARTAQAVDEEKVIETFGGCLPVLIPYCYAKEPMSPEATW